MITSLRTTMAEEISMSKLPRMGSRARYAFTMARTMSSNATGRRSKTFA